MKQDKLCHETFEEFIKILSESHNTPEEIFSNMGRGVASVAESLKIGRLSIRFIAPPSIVVPKGEKFNKVIYEKDCLLDENIITYQYGTFEGGKSFFEILLEKDTDREEPGLLENLEFVCYMLYILGGRARMLLVLKKMNLSDTATMLPNTEGFLQYIQKLILEGNQSKYCAFFINIKDFKYVNKLVDYRAGDRVLMSYVDHLNRFVNENEVVARLGGDNFATLIEKERVDAFIQHMACVRITLELGPRVHRFSFGMRAGMMRLDNTVQNPGQVMMGTSIALQIAKTIANKDIVCYSPEMNAQVLKEKEVAMSFGPALAQHEFIVYYQPKVNLVTNEISGAEALARWVRNDKIELPGDFISYLEKDGSICKLDFYILDNVCRDLKNWIALGCEPIRISSNFSRWNLKDPDFADKILQIVDKYGIDHQYIEIEVTETTSYEDFETMVAFAKKIKEYGFTTAIDDFGAGYSSLNLLKNLQVDVLKLDRCFLESLKLSERDKIVLENIIALAQALKVEVLAEGVETREHRDYLKALNCDTVQGYLYDKPMPEKEFFKKLSGKKAYTI